MKRVFRLGFVAAAAVLWGWSAAVCPAQGIAIEVNGNGAAIVEVKGGVILNGAVKIKAVAKAGGKDGDEEKEKEKEIKIPPKLEKALKEFVGKCVEVRREPARKEIEKVIEKIVEFHKLDEAATEKLKTLSGKAVESSLKPWGEGVDKYLRNALGEEYDESKGDESIDKFLKELGEAEAAEVASDLPAGNNSRPDQQPEWEAVLKEVLTVEQLAAWKKNLAEEKAQIEKQFAKLIEVTSDNYKRQYGSQMDPIVDDILSTVELDESRSEKLKAAAEVAIKAFIDHWKKNAAEHVESAEQSQRDAMLTRGYISIGVDSDTLPQKQEVWTKALEDILTKEEKGRWDAAIADRDSRRERAATFMMLAAVDELMALTVEQREALEPLLTDKAILPMTTQLKRDYWGSMNVTRIVQNAKEADQEKIEAILDEAQWERWQEAINPKSRSRSKPAKPGNEEKPPPGPDPVAIEKAVTAHMYRMMVLERDRILSNVLVRAEDAGRVLSLSPDIRRRLESAAKGAAEEEINTWANNMNSWVRRSVKGATPGNIDQRLRNLGSVRFGRSRKATDSPIWTAAVSTYLSDEQREIWQKEIEQRNACKRRATAALIVTQLDTAARLTADQVGVIEPLIATAIEEYGPDINRYFSSWSNDTPWYLNSYYNMIPFQGVPEKEAKKILTKAQWKVWEERFQNRVGHYWDQVLQYHDQRLKQEEKEKKEADKEEEKEKENEAVKAAGNEDTKEAATES